MTLLRLDWNVHGLSFVVVRSHDIVLRTSIQLHVKNLNPVYLLLGKIRQQEYFICRFESNDSIQYYGAHRYIHVYVEIILFEMPE